MTWIIKNLKWLSGLNIGVVYRKFSVCILACVAMSVVGKAQAVDILNPSKPTYYTGTDIEFRWDAWNMHGRCYLRIMNLDGGGFIEVGWAKYEDSKFAWTIPDDLVTRNCLFQILDSIQYNVMGNSRYFKIEKLSSNTPVEIELATQLVSPHPVENVLNFAQENATDIVHSTRYNIVHVESGSIVIRDVQVPCNIEHLQQGVYALVPRNSSTKAIQPIVFVKQ